MKLGVFLPFATPLADGPFLRAVGESAEAAGFDSLWVAEHVVLFDEYAGRNAGFRYDNQALLQSVEQQAGGLARRRPRLSRTRRARSTPSAPSSCAGARTEATSRL